MQLVIMDRSNEGQVAVNPAQIAKITALGGNEPKCRLHFGGLPEDSVVVLGTLDQVSNRLNAALKA